ncbi:M23 family metallopeptidase [Hazenella sp. IB182353]|uniref:M23 family metallopeptidase n=1 Tax=Polycladospora coralii TaxID=2771432 RepID=UPI0017476655|nr:M23 family metallopeptidase [Polycladospora coralii]MBS7529321.1 M23 family metallopeptidase [Polycladospora coralii]
MRKWIWGLLLAVLIVLFLNDNINLKPYFESHPVIEFRVPVKWSATYIQLGEKYEIPWWYLVAIDEVVHDYQGISTTTIEKNARWLQTEMGNKQVNTTTLTSVLEQKYTKENVKKMMQIASSYRWEAASLSEDYEFPFRTEDISKISYNNSWGNPRSYGGKRQHEGTDMMAPAKTPIQSVSDGKVVRKGWDRLGGWRLLIQDEKHEQIYYYYAHLSSYAETLKEGDRVKSGQIIGYVGDSGYGPEGTTGQFPPHLHFGMYVSESKFSYGRAAVNPYVLLKTWEN